MEKKIFAKRWFFSLNLIFGILFFLGALVTALKGVGNIISEITIGKVPFLVIGILLDFVINPFCWIGTILLFFAYRKRKRMQQLEK